MGMHLRAGRAPGVQDVAGGPPVGVLNETAARLFFGDGPAVGQTIQAGRRTIEIIGVVSDARYDSQRAAVRPTMCDSALPIEQLAPELRRAVAGVSPALPVPDVRSQVAQMDERIARERVFVRLLAIFGGFALLLASIGLPGVTAYSVSRRTNEIGIRMALGAQSRQVLWMVQKQVAWLGIAGLVLGVPLAYAAPARKAAGLNPLAALRRE